MQKLIFRNANGVEVDLTSGNFGITEWKGFSDVSLNLQTQQVPFQDGSVYLDGLLGNREISVTLAVNDNNDLEKRYELRRNLIEILNPKLGEGTLIYKNDYLMRQIKGVPLLPIFKNKNSNDRGTLKASLAWTCPSPYWEDVEETIVVFSNTEQPTIVNNGDVACPIKADILTFNSKNISFINQTTRKKISILGDITENVKIDTNMGNKRIQSEEFALEILKSDSVFVSSSKKGNDIFVFSKTGGIYKVSNDNKFFNSIPDEVSINKAVYSEDYDCFIIICEDGKLYKSQDLKEFELIEVSGLGDSDNLTDVAVKNEVIIIVGKNIETNKGFIIETADCETWNKNNFEGVLNSVCYTENEDKFIAVGNIIVQGNLQNWIVGEVLDFEYSLIRYVPLFGKIYLNKIIDATSSVLLWGNTISSLGSNAFLYIGEIKDCVVFENTLYLPSKRVNIYNLFYSYNGSNFYEDDVKLEDMSLAPSLNTGFFNENTGCYYFVGDKGSFLTSPDFVEWKNEVLKILNYYAWDIISVTHNSDGVFVLIRYVTQYYTTTRIYKISDGKKAESVYNKSSGSIFRKILYVEKYKCFYAIAENSSYIYKSNDCTTWVTLSTEIPSNKYLTDILFVESYNLIYACGKGGAIIESSDGMYFSATETGLSISGDFEFIMQADVYYVNFIGINDLWIERFQTYWHDYSNITETDNINTIKNFNYKDSFFALKGPSIYRGIRYSNWSRCFYDLTVGDINDIGFSEYDNIYCAVTENGYLIISYDGETWLKKLKYEKALKKIEINPQTRKLFIFGEDSTLIQLNYEVVKDSNLISSLSSDSDMALNLEKGGNIIRVTRDSGEVVIKLTYRQKYIGV